MRFWVLEKKGSEGFKGDWLAIGFFKGNRNPSSLNALPAALQKAVFNAFSSKEFEAEANQLYRIPTMGETVFKHLVLVGLGEEKKATPETFRKAAANVVLAAKNNRYSTIGIRLHETVCGIPFRERVQAVTEGALLASYEAPDYRTTKTDSEKRKKIDSIALLFSNGFSEAANTAQETQIVCENVFKARNWVNLSASIRTPSFMARSLQAEAKKTGVKCTILDKKKIQELKMGGLLAVNAGSVNPPVFVKLDYKPTRYKKTITLVGKGITFDSGGLNIKPWEGMLTMKQDMAGAATAAATVLTASQLRLPVRVLAFLPFTENMPANNAMKTQDIVTAFNGKTIEIIHTDAEGRVILADALSYAESHKPDFIIDLATLTGAQDVALGRYFIGAMGNNSELLRKIIAAGNKSMERCWELPLVDDWDEWIKGETADVRNIAKPKGEAGVLMAAAFLKQFVEKTPWVHLDIASTAFFPEGDSSRPYLPKGASGIGVRLLIEWLKIER
jgi:leucyl aminopeptidase